VRDPAHHQCLFGASDQMRPRLLGLADDEQRRGPESVHQRPLLRHLDVDIGIVAEPDAVQELVRLLEEVHRTQGHRHRGARREVAVAAGLGVRDEPRPLGQCIHRPPDLPDAGRGLSHQGQSLGPPHRVWVVLHVDE
jgi:hypothetical protein